MAAVGGRGARVWRPGRKAINPGNPIKQPNKKDGMRLPRLSLLALKTAAIGLALVTTACAESGSNGGENEARGLVAGGDAAPEEPARPHQHLGPGADDGGRPPVATARRVLDPLCHGSG